MTSILIVIFLLACQKSPPEKEYQLGIQDVASGQWWQAYQQFATVMQADSDYKDVKPQMFDVDSHLRRTINLSTNTASWIATSLVSAGWSSDPNYDTKGWTAAVEAELGPDGGVVNGTHLWAPMKCSEAYFRTTINLDKDPFNAVADVNADDDFELFVNGKQAGSGQDWTTVEHIDVAQYLHAGSNLIAAHARNGSGLCSFTLNLPIFQMPPQTPPMATAMSNYHTPMPSPTTINSATNTPTETRTSTPTQTVTNTPLVVHSTASATSTPTASITPDSRPFISRLDSAWAQADWPTAISVLQELRTLSPASIEYRDKLYVAFTNYGRLLLKKGDKNGAAVQFGLADDVDPSRGEAKALLQALTPTSTPAPPTATDMPHLNAADQHYLSTIAGISADTEEELREFGIQSQLVADDPSLLFDDSWRVKSAVILGFIGKSATELQNVEPVPPEFGATNADLVVAGQELEVFVTDYAGGADNLSAVQFSRALQHLNNANAALGRSTAELEKFKQKYGV